MSEPFVGEIRIFGFSRAPSGWLACDGSLLAISQYDALFSLLGTTYGGNGQTTFALPDLRGRIPLHQGQGPGLGSYPIGKQAGSETVTLTAPQMAAHSHPVQATSAAATSVSPRNTLLPGAVSGDVFYASDLAGATTIPMSAQSTDPTGGSLPHENTMPTLAMQYCIAVFGIYPSRN